MRIVVLRVDSLQSKERFITVKCQGDLWLAGSLLCLEGSEVLDWSRSVHSVISLHRTLLLLFVL